LIEWGEEGNTIKETDNVLLGPEQRKGKYRTNSCEYGPTWLEWFGLIIQWCRVWIKWGVLLTLS